MGCLCPKPSHSPLSISNIPPLLSNNRDSEISSKINPDKSIGGFSGCSFFTTKPLVMNSISCAFSIEYEILDNNSFQKTPFFDIKTAVHKHTGILVNVLIINNEFLKNLNIMASLETFQQIDHMNLLRLFEKYQQEDSTFLITEELISRNHQNTLISMVLNEKSPYNEAFLVKIIEQILNVLDNLHQKKLFYSNISHNLAFEIECLRIKLEDLFLINHFTSESLFYKAPELYDGFQGFSILEKSDIWAVGILLFLLITGKMPFFGKTPIEIKEKVLKFQPKIQEIQCSEELKDLLSQMLEKDPEKRPNVAVLLKNPWFLGEKGLSFDFDKGFLATLDLETKIRRIKALFLLNFFIKAEEKVEILLFFANFIRRNSLEGLKLGFLAEEIKDFKEELEKNKDFIVNFYDFSEFCLKFKTFDKLKFEEIFKSFDSSKKGRISIEEIVLKVEGSLVNLGFWGFLIEKQWKLSFENEVSLALFIQICVRLISC